MKKTIWIPMLIGLVFGLLNFMSWAIDLVIPMGVSSSGVQVTAGLYEIFNVLSAAIGGPISMVITEIINEIGAYIFFYRPGSNGAVPGYIMSLVSALIHVFSLLSVIFCYRFFYHRAKNTPALVSGWLLTIFIYFGLASVIFLGLLKFLNPDINITFVSFFLDSWPEALVTLIITTLALLALPKRFRRPVWYEAKSKNQPVSEEA